MGIGVFGGDFGFGEVGCEDWFVGTKKGESLVGVLGFGDVGFCGFVKKDDSLDFEVATGELIGAVESRRASANAASFLWSWCVLAAKQLRFI